MTSANSTYAIIMALTGVGIPVMAALNAGLGQRIGNPYAAAAVLFGVALALSLLVAGLAGAFQHTRLTTRWTAAAAWFYCGGAFVAFYVTAITVIAPRFGIGNAIFFVLLGQIASAAAIDHFGLLGVTKSELSVARCAGVVLMAVGVFLARKAA